MYFPIVIRFIYLMVNDVYVECDDLITMNLNIEVKDEGKDGEVNVVDETVKKVR